MGLHPVIQAVAVFLAGDGFIWGVDRLLLHLHLGLPIERSEGLRTTWQRSGPPALAITLYNLPEGLAVGVALGAAGSRLPSATLAGAAVSALGMGIQSLPEGIVAALPLRGEGLS